MTPSARVQAAIEMLELVGATPRPADGMIGAYFRGHWFIGSKDRGAITAQGHKARRRKGREMDTGFRRYDAHDDADTCLPGVQMRRYDAEEKSAQDEAQGHKARRRKGREMDTGFRRYDAHDDAGACHSGVQMRRYDAEEKSAQDEAQGHKAWQQKGREMDTGWSLPRAATRGRYDAHDDADTCPSGVQMRRYDAEEDSAQDEAQDQELVWSMQESFMLFPEVVHAR